MRCRVLVPTRIVHKPETQHKSWIEQGETDASFYFHIRLARAVKGNLQVVVLPCTAHPPLSSKGHRSGRRSQTSTPFLDYLLNMHCLLRLVCLWPNNGSVFPKWENTPFIACSRHEINRSTFPLLALTLSLSATTPHISNTSFPKDLAQHWIKLPDQTRAVSWCISR